MIIRSITTAATTAGTPPVSQSFPITGVGADKTVMAALYRATAGTALGTPVNAYRVLLGMTDGTTKRALGAMAENGQTAAAQDCETRISNTHVIDAPLGTDGSVNGLAELTSLGSGTSTLSWTDLLNAASLIAPVYLSDLANAKVVEFTHTGAQNGTQDVPDLGFAPEFAILYSHWSAYAADSNTTDGRATIGYAVKTIADAIEQFCINDQNQDNPTLDHKGATALRDDSCAWQVDETTDGSALSLTNWNGNTPTFTKLNAAANITAAILFGRFNERRNLTARVLSTSDLDTSTTGNKTIALGFQPVAYAMVGTTLATKNSTNRTNGTRSQWSEGWWTGFESNCISLQAGDNNGLSSSATRSITTAKIVDVLKGVLGGAVARDWEASHVAPTGGGVIVNIDTASAAGRISAIFAIGGVDQLWPKRPNTWYHQRARM